MYKSKLFTAMNNTIRNGNNFATIDIACLVLLTGGKKNPMKGRVMKHTFGIAIELGTNTNINAYSSKNNRNLDRAGETEIRFTIKPHRYAVQVADDTCVMVHKDNGTEYLRYMMAEGQVNATSHYTLDGEVIDKADIEGLKPAAPRAKIDGTDVNKAQYRLVKTENIVAIRAGGKVLEASDIR